MHSKIGGREANIRNSAAAARGALSLAALSALLLISARSAGAHTETVLYSFKGAPDGEQPGQGAPVMDKTGNLYGATAIGGAHNLGTVWKLTPSGKETVVWSFGKGTDGSYPIGVAMDKKGDLYGTTNVGGANNLGTAFEVTPAGKETVLWSFGTGTDGTYPGGTGPVLDSQGNLYGTTESGGVYNIGTVFEVTASGRERVLWSFGANSKDQPAPEGLMLAKNGNLYGTSAGNATQGKILYGTVWELTPSGTETVLYSFNRRDGTWPQANVVMDKEGNLYGACHAGGDLAGDGTVFKLTPSGTETRVFAFNGRDGSNPYGNTVLDNKGNLYSTTYTGTPDPQGGNVWELTPSGKETVLHHFPFDNGKDGTGPISGVVLDDEGNLYGATTSGGAHGDGVVYEVTP